MLFIFILCPAAAQVVGVCGETVLMPGSVSLFAHQILEEAKQMDDPTYETTRLQNEANLVASQEGFLTGIGACKANPAYSTPHSICAYTNCAANKTDGPSVAVNIVTSSNARILAGNGEEPRDFHSRQKSLQISDILTPDVGELLHLHQGDMVYLNPSGFLQVSDTEIWTPWALWPKGKVSFIFDASIDECARETVLAAISIYEKNTCLRFTEVDAKTAASQITLRIQSAAKGCWAYVGYANNAMVNLGGKGCQVTGIALHELGHAIGLLHGQSRFDRDTYVTVNWNNIETGDGDNFVRVKTSAAWASSILSTTYDYSSIMHYGTCEFSRSDSRDPNTCAETITPSNKTMKYIMGNRDHLSLSDIKLINKIYGCTSTCADGLKNQLETGVDCGGPCKRKCDLGGSELENTGIYPVPSKCQITPAMDNNALLEIIAIGVAASLLGVVLIGAVFRYCRKRPTRQPGIV